MIVEQATEILESDKGNLIEEVYRGFLGERAK